MKTGVGIFLCLVAACAALAQEVPSNSINKSERTAESISSIEAVIVAPTQKKVPRRAKISLRDGSVLFCNLKAKRLPFISTYGQELDIPLQVLQKIVFNQETNEATVHFLNNDRLTGSFAAERIQVKSVLGRVTIPLSAIQTLQLNHEAPAPAIAAKLNYKLQYLRMATRPTINIQCPHECNSIL